jgi:tetratricopeptide (TPR) repeat protein
MSIRPFSSNELENLRMAIEKNGWHINSSIENNFRYSLKKDKVIVFTIKLPVAFPLRINVPLEVVNFRLSIAFKIWDLNQTTNKLIVYLLKMLRDLAIQVSIEHSFPVEGKEKEIVDLLNVIIPESVKGENENRWKNKIRITLMSKRDEFKEQEQSIVDEILPAVNKSGLFPTFKLPWELKSGVPRIRTSETLFFSNDEPSDEFFIIEKGFLTYFKDLDYKKFYIRSGFDSYTPYVIHRLLNSMNVNLELLVDNWIKFARMMLNSMIQIIDLAEINQHDLIQFNVERELQDNEFEEETNNFAFSALYYESLIKKGELYQIHNDLFNSPPTNFEVLETINLYTEAEELIKNYRFDDATELLNQSLIVFNKNRQKKIVVTILLKLYHIASLLNRDEIALNYLQTALSLAKSGEVPIDYILKIHYKLGKYFFKIKNMLQALNHFNIIVNFLENEEQSINKEEYVGLATLYMGLIHDEQSQLALAKSEYKKAIQLANSSIKVKLNYYLLRAKQFKDKGNLSQSQKLLKAGIDAVGINFDEKQYQLLFFDIILELAEFYIHQRIDSKKAFFLLKNLENRVPLNMKEISGIKRGVRWNLLMSDYFDMLVKDSQNASYYYKQGQILVNQLKKIGVMN